MAVVVAVLVAAVALAVGQRGLVVDAPVPDPADWFVLVQISSACARLGTLVFVAQRRDLWWWKLACLNKRSSAPMPAPVPACAAERSIPTVDEVEAIVDAIDDRFRAAVVLAAYCGLRKGECFGLARRHVQLDGARPSVRIERTRSEVAGRGLVFQPPKTDAGSRVVSLPERVADELAQHLDRYVPNHAEALLFADPATGDVPRASRWTRIWNSARQQAGVADTTFHDLRHLAGTLTALAGGTLKEIQARLGHSSPDAAMIYQHVAHGRDDALAAEIDRIIGVPVP